MEENVDSVKSELLENEPPRMDWPARKRHSHLMSPRKGGLAHLQGELLMWKFMSLIDS